MKLREVWVVALFQHESLLRSTCPRFGVPLMNSIPKTYSLRDFGKACAILCKRRLARDDPNAARATFLLT